MTTENQVNENTPAVQEETQIVKVTNSNFIELAVTAVMKDFIAVNEGLDLDFVRMGDYIRLDKKGKFYDSADEKNVFGEELDVVIIKGEQRYTLWGAEDSPEKGQLIVSDRDENAAREALDTWLEENPQAEYGQDDIELRYIAWVVPVKTLSPDSPPQIYLISLPTTATIGFGKYAWNVSSGKYKALGVPARSSAKHVVTRLTTEDTKSKRDQSVSYLAIKFECLGLFNASDYGINVDEVNFN